MCVAALSGCTESNPVTASGPRILPSRNIVVSSSPTPDTRFYFLPPIGASPTSVGTPNPGLSPTVVVCTAAGVNVDGSCMKGDSIAVFTLSGGTQGEKVVVQDDSTYQVNWDASLYPNLLPPASSSAQYRITVWVGKLDMGYADVVVLNNSSTSTSYPGDVTMTNTQTLPIKFRIEGGPVCSADAVQCYTAFLTSQADTLIFGNSSEDSVGLALPAGAVSSPQSLAIERDAACTVPTGYEKFDPCWRFIVNNDTVGSYPLINGQTSPATVLLCPDAAGIANQDELVLYQSEYPYTDATPLPEAAVTYFTCPGQQTSWLDHVAGGRLAWLGRLVHPVVGLFTPTPLSAAHLGFGSNIGSFSNYQWALPFQLTPETLTTMDAGMGWTISVSVLVNWMHQAGAISDSTVTFTDSEGTTKTAVSDASGIATVQFTLPSVPEGYTVTASLPPASPVVFHVNVTMPPAYSFHFRPPMGSYTGATGPFVNDLEPTVEVCQLTGAGVCSKQAQVTYSGSDITVNGSQKQYQVNWSPADLKRMSNKTYLVQVDVDGYPLGHMLVAFTGTASDTLYVANIDNTIPIKFVVEQQGN